MAKQLSVFIENRQGRLGDVLGVLKDNGINILSLSLADTSDYGLLRLIVSNSKLGKEKLSESGFSTMLTDVLIVKITHKVGSLQKLLAIFNDENINIEYMYGLSVEGNDASVVLKPTDLNKALSVLNKNKIDTVSSDSFEK